MLRSYLRTTLAHLSRRPILFSIDVIGLGVGIGACLLIAAYVAHELSYDRFQPNADRIYRVVRQFDLPDLRTTIPLTPNALAPNLSDLADIEKTLRIEQPPVTVRVGAKQFNEDSFVLSDAPFFDFFELPILAGSPALDRPKTLLISETAAAKYFGGENPVGQFLSVQGERRTFSAEFVVTGVFGRSRHATHLQFDFLASRSTWSIEDSWGANNTWTYVLAVKGAKASTLQAEVTDAVKARNTSEPGIGNDFIPHLQPLVDVHLGRGVAVNLDPEGEMSRRGDIGQIYLLGSLGVIILLLACVNFTNLATARSAERAHEIGMRKVLGAKRVQVAQQFYTEMALVCAAAIVVGAMVLAAAGPVFSRTFDTEISLASTRSPALLSFLAVILLLPLLAGSYPAAVLSSFRPLEALTNRVGRFGSGTSVRKSLVIFQFGVTNALTIATLAIVGQYHHLTKAYAGFRSDNVLVIDQIDALAPDAAIAFKEELKSLAGVVSIGVAYSVPGAMHLNAMWRSTAHDNHAVQGKNLFYSFMDRDYLDTLNVQFSAGRNMSSSMDDRRSVILNETAAARFGWSPVEAIGRQISPQWSNERYTVVGVTEDFNFESMRNSVASLALFSVEGLPKFLAPERPRYTLLRLAPGSALTVVGRARAVWQRFSSLPLEFFFLDDYLASQYRSELQLSTVFASFSFVSIVIACLGLSGLASLNIKAQQQDIAVRKVFGASIGQIAGLVSVQTLRLVAVACLCSVPLGYFSVRMWLQQFASRIELGISLPILASVFTAFVALSCISWHLYRLAMTQPAKTLRRE